MAKGAACALSGGVAVALGILLGYGLFALVFLPREVYVDYVVPSRTGEILLKTTLFFLQGGCWALVGMLLSSIADSVYMAYAGPFILYYVLIILQERYLKKLTLLNPQSYLTLEGYWPLKGRSALIVLLVLFILLLLVLYVIEYERMLLRPRAGRRERESAEEALPERKHALRKRTTGLHRVWSVTVYHFRLWKGNLRVLVTFLLAFILCFLLSSKAVTFAESMGTIMQAFEPFIWTFGDANSVLLSSLLLVLLFADLPYLGAAVPYYLIRMKRREWVLGVVLYVLLATLVYILFIFAATSAICMRLSFIGNKWSETAAILGYSGAGKAVALPTAVKILELSRPYQCAARTTLLMLLYATTLSMLMLYAKLKRGKMAGILAAFGFSAYGFLLNPQLFRQVLQLPEDLYYQANVLTGWLSPLNHATYYMHNFGYDLLPRYSTSVAIFSGCILVLCFCCIRAIRHYHFTFLGSDET